MSLQYNKTDYDDYDCCYLQTPEFVAVSAGIQEDGVFNGWTSPFDPEAVAYYTASPTETATSDFRNLSMSVTGELFRGTQFAAGYESANFTYQNLLISRVKQVTLVVHQVIQTLGQETILLYILRPQQVF